MFGDSYRSGVVFDRWGVRIYVFMLFLELKKFVINERVIG